MANNDPWAVWLHMSLKNKPLVCIKEACSKNNQMDNDKWQIDKDRDKQVLLFIIVRLDSHHRYVPCLSISGVCETWIMGLR